MPKRSDTILDISTVHLSKPFSKIVLKGTPKNFQSGFIAQRRRGVLDGVFLYSEHLLCPNCGVWAEPSWFPFRDSGWLRPVIHRRENKLLSALCLSSKPVYFMLLCVILPTISNTFEDHYHGPLRRGKGWGQHVAWLIGWLNTCATKHIHHTLCS